MYFKMYQPNKKDLKCKVGDCTVRALTVVTEKSWVEVFDILCKYARESQTMPNSPSNIQAYFKDRNIPYVKCYRPKERVKLTVKEFTKSHRQGTFVIYCKAGFGTHLVAVKEGQYWDSWDSGNQIIYGYWEV